jgi:hypothetical protein
MFEAATDLLLGLQDKLDQGIRIQTPEPDSQSPRNVTPPTENPGFRRRTFFTPREPLILDSDTPSAHDLLDLPLLYDVLAEPWSNRSTSTLAEYTASKSPAALAWVLSSYNVNELIIVSLVDHQSEVSSNILGCLGPTIERSFPEVVDLIAGNKPQLARQYCPQDEDEPGNMSIDVDPGLSSHQPLELPEGSNRSVSKRPRILCVLCEQNFTRASDLVRHQKTMHSARKQCPFCTRLLSSGRRDKLKEHLLKVHKMGPEVASEVAWRW